MSEKNLDDRQQALQGRADWYRLFGALLYREVSLEWLKAFQDGLKQQWMALGCQFDEDIEAPLEQLKEELDAEFTTLWIAPGAVPRFESIFETGMVFQQPCDQVSAIYRAEGFDYDADAEKSFPDHAGVELEFLGHLLDKQRQALLNNQPEEAERLQQVFLDFLRQHAGTWIPAMMNYSVQAAEHSFYRELGRLVLSFLLSEFEEELPRRERERLLALLEREPKEVEYDADFRKASGL